MNAPGELLRQRRFLPLFVTQFLGAMNDNVLKNAMIVLLTFEATAWTTLAPGILANLAAGIFILPFFLFSATAGELADQRDKAWLARWIKALELCIVLIAGLGFALRSLEILMASLFLLGLHSTFFGPIKYAILPQHLKPEELLAGNALIEAGTFLAILCGTLLGGLLAALPGATGWISAAGFVIAVGGFLAARKIPAAVPPAPTLRVSRNPLAATLSILREARRNPEVARAIFGISWFWLYGAVFLAQLPGYAKTILGGEAASVTWLLVTFIAGIGAGSLLCERITRRRTERRQTLVLAGAFGLGLFALDLSFASQSFAPPALAVDTLTLLRQPGMPRVLFDLTLIGLCGGLFTVPLYTRLQEASAPAERARMIAANNIVNALLMVVGSLAAAALLAGGWAIPSLFALLGLITLLLAARMGWMRRLR
ncbi:MAG: MFS transporter [Betaproteobacteria bacterium HGW-Betaproteobacteria-11]|nr:MAG: MFS transporter [Betaproteobacteria bacterium HGW-Betaproteobacteria-11]